MADTRALARLGTWFEAAADGEWEHRIPITIEALDEPGWALSIDLSSTAWEGLSFKVRNVRRSETDWFVCRVENGIFRGYCGPRNLDEELDVFLAWVEGSTPR